MVHATSKFVWQPDEETLGRANVVRLMRRHGFDDYWELVRRSHEDPEWFWPAAIEDMGLEFSEPWDEVVDLSRGPEWATWFVGGKLNIAWNCVHRWATSRANAIASVGLGEDGTRREQTFGELSREVTRLAEALVRLGVREGDRVAIFLPMSPEIGRARRGRHAPRADLRRALARGDEARGSARPARRTRRRPRGDLPADVARDRSGSARTARAASRPSASSRAR